MICDIFKFSVLSCVFRCRVLFCKGVSFDPIQELLNFGQGKFKVITPPCWLERFCSSGHSVNLLFLERTIFLGTYLLHKFEVVLVPTFFNGSSNFELSAYVGLKLQCVFYPLSFDFSVFIIQPYGKTKLTDWLTLTVYLACTFVSVDLMELVKLV